MLAYIRKYNYTNNLGSLILGISVVKVMNIRPFTFHAKPQYNFFESPKCLCHRYLGGWSDLFRLGFWYLIPCQTPIYLKDSSKLLLPKGLGPKRGAPLYIRILVFRCLLVFRCSV